MRRSAAPSFKSSAKRLKFLPPIQNLTSNLGKENDILNFMDPEIAENFNSLSSNEEPKTINDAKSKDIVTNDETGETNLRSTSEILQLILGAVNDPETSSELKPSFAVNDLQAAVKSQEPYSLKIEPLTPDNRTKVQDSYVNVDSAETSSNLEASVCRYDVLWCKRSTKKHKVWEGDGVLIVRNRSAVLKDSEGKEIDRGMGYRLKDVSSLEEGSKFYVGGKECEIQSLISTEVSPQNQKSKLDNTDCSTSVKLEHPKLKIFKSSKPCM